MIYSDKTLLIARHSEGMELVVINANKNQAVEVDKSLDAVIEADIMKKTGEIAMFTGVYKHKKGKLYAHFCDVIYKGVEHCVYYRLVDHTWWIRPHYMFHGLDENGVKRFTFQHKPVGVDLDVWN